MLYPEEVLSKDDDDGTMPGNVEDLREAVIGHRIVSIEEGPIKDQWDYEQSGGIITLDNGKKVTLADTSDCCAFTELAAFFLHPDKIDHIITGVGTTDGYTTWHIYADAGDVLEMAIRWSPGNPFYYGYGFDIKVLEN